MSVFAKSMALIEKQRETTHTASDVRTPLTVRLPAPPTHMLTIQITLRILPVINRLVASKPPRPRMRIEFRRVYTLMVSATYHLPFHPSPRNTFSLARPPH